MITGGVQDRRAAFRELCKVPETAAALPGLWVFRSHSYVITMIRNPSTAAVGSVVRVSLADSAWGSGSQALPWLVSVALSLEMWRFLARINKLPQKIKACRDQTLRTRVEGAGIPSVASWLLDLPVAGNCHLGSVIGAPFRLTLYCYYFNMVLVLLFCWVHDPVKVRPAWIKISPRYLSRSVTAPRAVLLKPCTGPLPLKSSVSVSPRMSCGPASRCGFPGKHAGDPPFSTPHICLTPGGPTVSLFRRLELLLLQASL